VFRSLNWLDQRDRLPPLGDDDLFALFDPAKVLGEAILGLGWDIAPFLPFPPARPVGLPVCLPWLRRIIGSIPRAVAFYRAEAGLRP